jgi:hypothetical protein
MAGKLAQTRISGAGAAKNRTLQSANGASFLGFGGTGAKKLVVKARDFPYQFGQMHRVGAGGKLFLPRSVRTRYMYQNNKLTGGTK